MKKVKITTEQYNRLFTTKLTESAEKAPLEENVFSSEMHQAVSELIHNIWLNPSQSGLSTFFKQNGITWGDIISYLTGVGVLGAAAGGVHKLLNMFKTKFSKQPEVAQHQKEQDIQKIVDKISKDPKATWNIKASNDPSLGNNNWEYEPKYNPNRFKPLTSTPKSEYDKLTPHIASDSEVDETSHINNYPAGFEEDPNSPINQKVPDEKFSNAKQLFKPLETQKDLSINKEALLLNGPDGLYVFFYGELNREDFPNEQLILNIDDIVDYVNQNYTTLPKGVGAEGVHQKGVLLVKLDPKGKEALGSFYPKNKEFINLLNRVEEMTGAASSGAFTAPMGSSGSTPKIEKKNTPSNALISDEEEFLGGKNIEENAPHSSSTFMKLIKTAEKDGHIKGMETSAQYVMSAAKKIAELYDKLSDEERKVKGKQYYQLFLREIGKGSNIEEDAPTNGKLGFLIGKPINLIRTLYTQGKYDAEKGEMAQIQRQEEISGPIKSIDASNGVPMLVVANSRGSNAASVMWRKTEFVEGWSSFHYVYTGATPKDTRILELFKANFYDSPDESIAETTMAAGGTPQAGSSGQYTQPAMWAKDKKNWKGGAKPQYPNGKIVDKTNDVSIIGQPMYETIAKKTGRSIEDVKKIIETKLLKNKPL